jgi:hypothetical protein
MRVFVKTDTGAMDHKMFCSVKIKRVSDVNLSLFNPEYTIRSQMVKFLINSKIINSKIILDFGAGNSPYRKYFNYEKYITADVDYNVEIKPELVIDPECPQLAIDGEQIDLALCLDVLEHTLKPKESLLEINRVLKKNCFLLIKVPMVYREHEVPYDFRRWTTYGLTKDLEEAGFRIVELHGLGNSWSSAYTLINERFVLSSEEMPIVSKIAQKLFNIAILPLLNLTLFKIKNPGTYGSIVGIAQKEP